MIDVRIESRDPFATSTRDLVDEIAALDKSLQVEDETPAFLWDGPVPVWEVISIYIGMRAADAVTRAAIDAVLEAATAWARRAVRDDAERPKRLTIYGPDGEVLQTIRVPKPRSDDRD